MRALAVIVNIFFCGIGTIIAGKTITGVIQFLIYSLAWALIATGFGAILGLPMLAVVWIWGIISAATAADKPLVVVMRDDDRPPRR